MRLAEIDANAVAAVVARLPGEFRTKDVSEAEEMFATHPVADLGPGFPALVGRWLSTDRLELGIVEATKGGRRGSTWQKKQAARPDVAVPAPSHGAEVSTSRSRRPPDADALMGELPAWDAQSLQVRSDSPRTARYRLLQSWYREVVLGVPPAKVRGRLVGSMLTSSPSVSATG